MASIQILRFALRGSSSYLLEGLESLDAATFYMSLLESVLRNENPFTTSAIRRLRDNTGCKFWSQGGQSAKNGFFSAPP